MEIRPFALERYFARWEFNVEHLLCASDPEAIRLPELLAVADAECLEWWGQLSLGYTESQGAPLLRSEIATEYTTLGIENVLTLAGAQEGIFLTMHAHVRAGDRVLVVSPAYQSLHEVARSIGAEVVDLPLDEATGWAFPLDLLRRELARPTRLVVINSPHNPTGGTLTPEEFHEIVQLCDRAGAHLFSDEVYRRLEFDPAQRLPCVADAYERGISLNVMSKAYGAAGLRVGWVATRDAQLLERIAQLKDYTTICSSAPSEVLATMVLRARAHFEQRTRTIVLENLGHIDAFFERNAEHIAWSRPRGGTIGFPRLLGRNADDFAAELVKSCRVLILPGSRFGCGAHHFRLGFGRRDLPVALAAFERHLQRA